MPDWTYHPLRPIAVAVLGPRRAHRAALRSLAVLAGLPGGRCVIGAFLHERPRPEVADRLGVVVPPDLVADARRALPPLGATVVETEGGHHQNVHVLDDPDVDAAARLLLDPAATVLATPGLLLEAGPGWFQRVAEALDGLRTPPTPAPGLRDVDLARPWRWPGWFWGLLTGLGMIAGGLVAALITLGPVLLWYDRRYLGAGVDQLDAVDVRLVPFLQHDRLTLAGTMVTIGILYAGLAWGGLRAGRRWAWTAYLASGAVGFPTLFYYLGTGFVDPLHAFATAVLFPMFALTVWLPQQERHWVAPASGPEGEWRRALAGQLLMIMVGVALFIGGATISVIGLTDVFVSTDLGFLRTSAEAVREFNPLLPGFIAHDRAGFGGALISAAVAIVLLSAWGWRRGEAWVWWVLAAGATTGFGTTLVIHVSIGYTNLQHIWPVLVGAMMSAAALGLARPYLTAADHGSDVHPTPGLRNDPG